MISELPAEKTQLFTSRDITFRAAFTLFLLTFVLFPIAHLSVFGLPIYWSEATFLLSMALVGLFHRNWLLARLSGITSAEKQFFFFVSLFVAGVFMSYILNPHTFSGWGEIKSFYIVPVLFLMAIRIWGETFATFRDMAVAWTLGVFAASLASLAAAGSGWYLYDGRLAGLYQSPNHLAMLVAPGILLGLQLFRLNEKKKRNQLLLILSIFLAVFTLWLTRSYAAWLALGVATTLLCFEGGAARFGRRAFLASILVAALFFIQEHDSEKWQDFVSGSERSSTASRVMIWRSAARIATDSLPWGIGTGRFQEVYLEYQRFYPPYLEWAVPTPHNLYLHFLLEGGVVSLVGWLGAIIWLGILSLRSLSSHEKGQESRAMLVLGLSLLLFYLVYGLIDTPYMKNDLALAVWGSFGFVLAALRIRA